NGSYLVMRELDQDVGTFKTFFSDNGAIPEAQAQLVASKVIGRTPAGIPLVPYTSPFDNEFGYAEDPYGYGCPIGSHVRRANPRDTFTNTNEPPDAPVSTNRHRI